MGGEKLRILVTDAQELAGLGAIRSLGRAGHAVMAAYPNGQALPAAARSRYCAGVLRYPDPWRHQPLLALPSRTTASFWSSAVTVLVRIGIGSEVSDGGMSSDIS